LKKYWVVNFNYKDPFLNINNGISFSTWSANSVFDASPKKIIKTIFDKTINTSTWTIFEVKASPALNYYNVWTPLKFGFLTNLSYYVFGDLITIPSVTRNLWWTPTCPWCWNWDPNANPENPW
jgi:hypothetical protein